MTLDTLIMLAGALVAAVPLLGIPVSAQQPLLFFLGVATVALGIIVRRRGTGRRGAPPIAETRDKPDVWPQSPTFVESAPPGPGEHESA